MARSLMPAVLRPAGMTAATVMTLAGSGAGQGIDSPSARTQDSHHLSLGAATQLDETVLRVISITDFRGALTPRVTAWSEGGRVGGVGSLDAWMDSLANRCECTSIRVAAGDQLRGSLLADRVYGRSVVQALNALTLDAAVPGPEDFQLGLDSFKVRVAESGFPWIAANVELARGGRPDWLFDWVFLERDGKNIAVVGVTDNQADPPFALDPAEALRLTDPVAAVQRTLGVLAAGEFAAVIVVAHLPATCEATVCEGRLIDFVRSLPPGSVDLVVGGHSDTEASAVINGIPLVLPGSYGISVAASDLIDRARGGREVETSIATVWQDSVTANLNLTLTSVQAVDAAELDRELTEVRFGMSAGDSSDTPYGNFLADAYRNATRSHAAIVMNGDVGAGLPPGPQSLRTIYEIQPVHRQLVRVTVDGRLLKAVLEDLLQTGTPAAHLSGLWVDYDPSRNPGDRIRRIQFPDGRRVDDRQSYTLGVSQRVAAGAEGSTRLAGQPVVDAEMSDFDALVNYLTRLPSPVEAPLDKRFRRN